MSQLGCSDYRGSIHHVIVCNEIESSSAVNSRGCAVCCGGGATVSGSDMASLLYDARYTELAYKVIAEKMIEF